MVAGKKLGQDFFDQNAVELAPLLLGQYLCRKTPTGVLRLAITETEAYYTEADTACHAHKGRTKRTDILYRRGGCAYIYLCYGMYNLLNVVCGEAEIPQAVLIRGAGAYDGPGKLTRALDIDRSLNGADLVSGETLWLEAGQQPAFRATPRIGIQYATEEYRNMPWRFVAAD
ncbi:MAG: DNA-3-methyladenine glycosylase [Clostridia bacterium]